VIPSKRALLKDLYTGICDVWHIQILKDYLKHAAAVTVILYEVRNLE